MTLTNFRKKKPFSHADIFDSLRTVRHDIQFFPLQAFLICSAPTLYGIKITHSHVLCSVSVLLFFLPFFLCSVRSTLLSFDSMMHDFQLGSTVCTRSDCTHNSKCWKIKHSDRIILTLAKGAADASRLIEDFHCRWMKWQFAKRTTEKKNLSENLPFIKFHSFIFIFILSTLIPHCIFRCLPFVLSSSFCSHCAAFECVLSCDKQRDRHFGVILPFGQWKKQRREIFAVFRLVFILCFVFWRNVDVSAILCKHNAMRRETVCESLTI